MENQQGGIWKKILRNGITEDLSLYNKKRTFVFNLLNFSSFLYAALRIVYLAFFSSYHYSATVLAINSLPVLLFLIFPLLTYRKHYTTATILFFLLTPPVIAAMAFSTRDNNMYLFLVVCCLLPFFYLNRPRNTISAFVYSLLNYCILIILQHSETDAVPLNDKALAFLNYAGSFSLLFIMAYMVKYQVWSYEKSIRKKKEQMVALNEELLQQKGELQENKLLLNKLFSIICHDLKTPVYGLKNIFAQNGDQSMTYDEFIDLLPYINKDIDDTVSLMENVLAWSRNQVKNEKPHPEKIMARTLAEEAIAGLKKDAVNKKITVLNYIPAYCHFWADKMMIQSAVKNILGNAVKYSRTGGKIKLSAEPAGNNLELVIADTGVGINEEDLPNIFKSSFKTTAGTNNETGAGLGLIISKDLILHNRGDIRVDSSIGLGTTVTIQLPLSIPQETRITSRGEIQPVAAASATY